MKTPTLPTTSHFWQHRTPVRRSKSPASTSKIGGVWGARLTIAATIVALAILKDNFSFHLSVGNTDTPVSSAHADNAQPLTAAMPYAEPASWEQIGHTVPVAPTPEQSTTNKPKTTRVPATPTPTPKAARLEAKYPTPPSKPSKPKSATQQQPRTTEASVVSALNLANPATAVGAALTPEQQAEAAKFSNLGFILNPSAIKKYQVGPEVVQHKRQVCINYTRKIAPYARHLMKEHNIPASITLAQALLESNAGDSKLARECNNHFGIKCFSRSCRRGHCVNMTDDSHKDFFRKYPQLSDCFDERANMFQRDRYKHLLRLPARNYRAWAKGLKAAGYATAPNYAEALITIIEDLQLWKYDR